MTSKIAPDLLDLLVQANNLSNLEALKDLFANFAHKEWDSTLSFNLKSEPGDQTQLSFQPDTALISEHNATETSGKEGNFYIHQTDEMVLLLPLTAGGEQIGSVAFSRKQFEFNENEINEMRIFSKIAANTLQSLRFSTIVDYQNRTFDLIANLASKLAGITKLDTLMQEACHLIAADLHYYYVSIWSVAEENDLLNFGAYASASTASEIGPIVLNDKIFVGQHIIGTAAATSNSLLVADVSQEPLYYSADALPETQSELAIPLKVGKEVLGVLDLQSDKKNGFTQADLTLLSALADSIALAMHRVGLYATLELRTDQMDLIARVGKSLTSVLDLDTLLNQIAQMMHDEFNYQEVQIFLVEHAPLRIQYRAGSGVMATGYKDIVYTIDPKSKLGLIPEVIRTGKVQFVNDVSEEPKFLPSPFKELKVGSELVVPLEFGGRVFGVLDVQDARVNAFSQTDVDLLTTLSANISIAVRNASLYNTQLWRRKVAESLRDIALSLAKSLPFDETLQKILSSIMKVLPSDFALIALFEPESPTRDVPGGKLKLHAFNSPNDLYLPVGMELETDSAWFMHGFETLHPVIRQTEMPDQILGHLGLSNDASAISAPLTVGDKRVGVLILYNAKPYRYGTEATRLASTWSGYIGIALENQGLGEETEAQSWLSTILLQVALSTRSLTEVRELTRVMGQLIMLLIGGRAGGIVAYDVDRASFTLNAVFGRAENSGNLPIEICGTEALGKAIKSQTLTAIPGVELEEEIRNLFGLNIKSTVLLMPLTEHERPLGLLLHVGNAEYIDLPPEQVLGKQAIAILQGIAQQTALSLQNISLVSAAEEETMVSSFLLQVSKILVGSSELEAGLNQTIQMLCAMAGFDYLAFLRYDPDTYSYEISYRVVDLNYPLTLIERAKIEEKHLPSIQLFSSLNAMILPFKELSFLLEPNTKQTGTPLNQPKLNSHWVATPVMAQNERFGLILALDSHAAGQTQRIELLKGVAQQIASDLQMAQFHHVRHQQNLVEKELNLARQIQKNFLPDVLPEIRGYQTAVTWQTAKQVGGDFYDLFNIDATHWGFVIADVSDKGLPAALYMTVARTLIRAMGLDTPSPAATLEKVNHLLQLDSKGGYFITTFYGVLDLTENSMTYALAGHNPPVIINTQSGSATLLNKGGIALGIFDPVNYIDEKISFELGDALVLYTDGVTETSSESGELFGNKHMLKTLSDHMHETPTKIISALVEVLDQFKGDNPPSDDVTLLVVKRQ
jgi:sigma-B regulation protein RsbU (phosphoserine phosphatase)